MERKERKFEFKHYDVSDERSCVDGLEALRTYKPQSIESQPNLNIKIPKHRSAEGENMLQTWKSGWTFQKAVLNHFWFLAQNHCQWYAMLCPRYRLSTAELRKPYADSTHSLGKCKLTNPMLCYVQDMEFRLNIWFLEPPESRFQPFLVPDPKLLPEGLKNMARELFLDLDRISGFWTVQFWRDSGSWPQTIARTTQKHASRAIFRSGPNIWFFVSKETYEIMFTEKGQHRTLQWTIGSKMRKVSYNSIFIGNLYRVLPYKTTFANIW